MFMTILFLLLIAGFVFSIIRFAFRAAFGAGKFLAGLVFIPIIILLVVFGFFKFLLPILIIGGIVLFVIGIVRGASRVNRNEPQDYPQDHQQNYRQDFRQDFRQDQRTDYIDADFREVK